MTSARLYRTLADYLGLGMVLIAMIAFFALKTDYFFTLTTFRTIANQIPDAVIIATGMTFVLIIAGIDLSVGSVLALGGATLGLALTGWGWPIYLAVPLCIIVGLCCGAVNGIMVAGWRLPAFIVTLGMLEAARGGAYLVTGSKTQYIGSSVEWINTWGAMGLSLPFLLALLVVITGQFILSYTIFGRSMFAIGGNEEAARLSGIPVAHIKTAVYTLCGGLAALAAVIHCSRLTAADPNAGIGYELQAIAAVVIGGTSLMGGRGAVINTFIGVIIIAVLENGLVQMGAQEPIKRLVTGAVIIIAVILDYYRHRV
ncbi:MAG TPA: ABC transporter permease [Candidatus Hydrogenedentes bacterium]|nr:ABC transporter permease [Candidatus Hydrogenedentota bacterium]